MENGVTSTNTADNSHKVFKNDPKHFKTLINKTVEITTVDDKSHKGRVYVVDPVSESVVTVTNCKEKCDVNIFLGHAIKSIHVCNVKENTSDLFITNTQVQNEESLNEKKASLKAWLQKNLIDVVEDEMTLKLGDDLIIKPPYDKEHCFSSNTIILQRVQEILNKMPNTK